MITTKSRAAAVSGVAAALLAAGLSATASTTPAFAANFASYVASNSGGANLRECPNTGCRSFGWMSNGTRLEMVCWTDAQWVAPPNSNYGSQRWFKVWTTALGATGGYVHSSLVANQIAVPRC